MGRSTPIFFKILFPLSLALRRPQSACVRHLVIARTKLTIFKNPVNYVVMSIIIPGFYEGIVILYSIRDAVPRLSRPKGEKLMVL